MRSAVHGTGGAGSAKALGHLGQLAAASRLALPAAAPAGALPSRILHVGNACRPRQRCHVAHHALGGRPAGHVKGQGVGRGAVVSAGRQRRPRAAAAGLCRLAGCPASVQTAARPRFFSARLATRTQQPVSPHALLLQVAGQVVLVLAHVLLCQVSVAGSQDGRLRNGGGGAGQSTGPNTQTPLRLACGDAVLQTERSQPGDSRYGTCFPKQQPAGHCLAGAVTSVLPEHMPGSQALHASLGHTAPTQHRRQQGLRAHQHVQLFVPAGQQQPVCCLRACGSGRAVAGANGITRPAAATLQPCGVPCPPAHRTGWAAWRDRVAPLWAACPHVTASTGMSSHELRLVCAAAQCSPLPRSTPEQSPCVASPAASSSEGMTL